MNIVFSRKTIAVITAVIMVSAGVVVLAENYRNGNGPDNDLRGRTVFIGPYITLSSNGKTLSVENNTTIQLEIYAPVPNDYKMNSVQYCNFKMNSSNLTNNSLSDMVLNLTLLPFTHNSSRYFMNGNLVNIISGWSSAMDQYTGKNNISLTVMALKTVDEDGNISIYQYYNNLPFNPLSIHPLLTNVSSLSDGTETTGLTARNTVNSLIMESNTNLTGYRNVCIDPVGFNLSLSFPKKPFQTIKNTDMNDSSTNKVPLIERINMKNRKGDDVNSIKGAGCSEPLKTGYSDLYYTSTSDSLQKATRAQGVLPLSVVHMGRNADMGDSLVVSGSEFTMINDDLKINSNQVYESSSGEVTTTMSGSASYEHMANLSSAVTLLNSQNAYPTHISEKLGDSNNMALDNTTVMLGISGVTFCYAHYGRYTYHHEEELEYEYCPDTGVIVNEKVVWNHVLSTIEDGDYSIGRVVNINTANSLELTAEHLPIQDSWVMEHYLTYKRSGSLSLNTSGEGNEYSSTTIFSSSQSWLNTSSVYEKIGNALSIFSSALGIELTIMSIAAALNGGDGDLTEGAVILDAASIINSYVGMSATLMGMYSTIASISGSGYASVGISITNSPIDGGSGYNVDYYESTNPISYTLGGNSYSFYAPEDFYNVTSII